MLLEIITKTETSDEDGMVDIKTETDRYISVQPESLQIRRNPEFTGKTIPADANPHVLSFMGKPMCYLSKNADFLSKQYLITLTTDMTFRLLTEKGEKCPHLDLSLFVDGKPAASFKDIKIQRNNGLIYRANFERIILGVKYKETTGNSSKAPAGRYYSANIELFSRWSTTLSTCAGVVKEVKLVST